MSEVAVEEFEHAGITCKIILDFDAGDPRESRDTLTVWHWATNEWRTPKHDLQIDLDAFRSESHSAVDKAARYLTLLDGYAIAIPFDIVNYGGGSYRANLDVARNTDRCTGFVTVPQSELEKELALSPEWDVMEYIKAEFAEFEAYTAGEVYGWVVADGEDDEESCWGYYGDLEYVRSEARDRAEEIAKDRFVNEEPRDIAEVLR